MTEIKKDIDDRLQAMMKDMLEKFTAMLDGHSKLVGEMIAESASDISVKVNNNFERIEQRIETLDSGFERLRYEAVNETTIKDAIHEKEATLASVSNESNSESEDKVIIGTTEESRNLEGDQRSGRHRGVNIPEKNDEGNHRKVKSGRTSKTSRSRPDFSRTENRTPAAIKRGSKISPDSKRMKICLDFVSTRTCWTKMFCAKNTSLS